MIQVQVKAGVLADIERHNQEDDAILVDCLTTAYSDSISIHVSPVLLIPKSIFITKTLAIQQLGLL